MTRGTLWTAVLIAAGCCVTLLAQTAGGDGTDGAYRQQEELDALYRQIHESYRNLADDPGKDDQVVLDGHPQKPDLTTGLTVLSRKNPLLTEECKKEALYRAIHAHSELKGKTLERSLEDVKKHIQQQQSIITGNGISFEGYYKHLTECKGFCGPHAVELLNCHVLAVANSNRDIVLFDWDSSYVSSAYNANVVRRFADEMARDPARRLLLIGRASPPGPQGHNMGLSARRAFAIQDILEERGVDRRRISTLWLGEEPPQLEDWIAEKYGLREIRDTLGYDQLNQSVITLIY